MAAGGAWAQSPSKLVVPQSEEDATLLGATDDERTGAMAALPPVVKPRGQLTPPPALRRHTRSSSATVEGSAPSVAWMGVSSDGETEEEERVEAQRAAAEEHLLRQARFSHVAAHPPRTSHPRRISRASAEHPPGSPLTRPVSATQLVSPLPLERLLHRIEALDPSLQLVVAELVTHLEAAQGVLDAQRGGRGGFGRAAAGQPKPPPRLRPCSDLDAEGGGPAPDAVAEPEGGYVSPGGPETEGEEGEAEAHPWRPRQQRFSVMGVPGEAALMLSPRSLAASAQRLREKRATHGFPGADPGAPLTQLVRSAVAGL